MVIGPESGCRGSVGVENRASEGKNESALNTLINPTGKQSITEEIRPNAIFDNLKRTDFSDKHLKESKVRLGEEEI